VFEANRISLDCGLIPGDAVRTPDRDIPLVCLHRLEFACPRWRPRPCCRRGIARRFTVIASPKATWPVRNRVPEHAGHGYRAPCRQPASGQFPFHSFFGHDVFVRDM